MSRALKGEHLCLQHQGNHSHYAEENCVICKQEKRIAELEQVLIKLESRTSGQCTLESLNSICRVALGKEIEK